MTLRDSLAREEEASHHVLFTAFWCWGAVVTDCNASLGSRTSLCLALYKRSERQVSPVSQENRNTQTTPRVRATSRGFSTSKPPRSCHTLYGATARKFEKEFDGDLCYLVLLKVSRVLWLKNFWGVLIAAWLMRCVWGCGGLDTRVWWQGDRKVGTRKLQDRWQNTASLPSSVLALDV